MITAALAVGLVTPVDASARRIGSYNVYGAIEIEYDQAGGWNLFGNPTNSESAAARGGRWQAFEKSSSIYWHPNVSNGHANQVGGAIRDKWADHKWENGPLGYPSSDEFKGNNNGAGQHFEGGSVYWSGNTGAHSVWGMTRDHWAQNGWENKQYGYPTGDEDKNQEYEDGYRQDFQGGSIQVVDMKVPAYGYKDSNPTARDGGGERSSTTTPPSPSGTNSPAPEEKTNPGTKTPVRPTPPASIMPTTPGMPQPAPGVTSRTWPFGDFCVLGTYGGPGGGCRFGDGVSFKDAKCMGAIVVAAGSLAVPAAKIAQFRKFVKSVGGAKEAYELWRGASNTQDRANLWAATGQISLSVAGEILGIDSIVKHCR